MCRFTLAFVLIATAACSTSSSRDDCGGDGELVTVGTGRYCAYVVIEGGFTCPASMGFRFDLPDLTVCSDQDHGVDDIPPIVCQRVGRRCDSTIDDGGAVDRPDAGSTQTDGGRSRQDAARPADGGTCDIVGTRDCAAIAAVSGDLTVEQCLACQGIACGTDTTCDALFPCVADRLVIQGCCSDEDCTGIAPFCGRYLGVNDVCVPDDDI